MTCVALAQRNITNNPGILPIKLGNAKFQTSTHTFIHYFELSELISEYNIISNHIKSFKNTTDSNNLYSRELSNYYKIINYNLELINEKLNPFIKESRSKRGLIDGIGSIIKQLTGNLDANDGEQIKKSLEIIKKNQNNIAHQLNNQYSTNDAIIIQFNETVKNIKHNENLIRLRVEELENIIDETTMHSNILFAKDTANQFIHLLNVILNILQDIENSVTFCHHKMLHPSIITALELLNELQKISSFYSTKLPFKISPQTIQNYKQLIRPLCFQKNSEIIYTLSLPLFSKTNYNLFYFLPIPTFNYQTIIPNSNYILKSDESEIVPLSEICDYVNYQYFCLERHRVYRDTTCERSILVSNRPENCSRVQLPIQQIVEYIPEVNKYLGAFPLPTIFKSHCQEILTKEEIQGILLFEDDDHCQYSIDNQTLIFKDNTTAKPLIIEDLHITKTEHIKTKLPKIHFKSLQLAKLTNNPQQIELIEEDDYINPWHITGTVALYVILLFSGCIILIYKYCINRKTKPTSQPPILFQTRTDPIDAKF